MKIVTYPNPVLRTPAVAVPAVGKAERRLMVRMLKHMRQWKGIGLAAPQVGCRQQIFVADVEGSTLTLANAVILEQRGTGDLEEGCLSLPGIIIRVTRPAIVWLRALNDGNRQVDLKLEGLAARVAQHEIDHLHGKLILDYGLPAGEDAWPAAGAGR